MAPMNGLEDPPPTGHPVPDTYHAVSVQMNTWLDMQGLMLGHPRVKKVQRIGYPRSFLHPDVVKIHEACLRSIGASEKACLLYPSANHAFSCKNYVTKISKGENSCNDTDVEIRPVVCDVAGRVFQGPKRNVRLYAVIIPDKSLAAAMGFWRLTGTGISSRLAQDIQNDLCQITVVPLDVSSTEIEQAQLSSSVSQSRPAYAICERIVSLVQRAALQPSMSKAVSPSDVFLYPTGMSAIYHCNLLLQKLRPMESIVFGFPYELTLKMLQTYGKSCRFYGFGTPEELRQLELYLEAERLAGRKVQSVWCEIASNPLLRTVDLHRVRDLADKYHFQLIIDDTIGSFANVDVLGVADVIVTSLTKSFSGFADVMGGSIILNPASPFHSEMKYALSQVYCQELYTGDAEVLEYNSRGFLQRATKMNQTAEYLVRLLHPYTQSPLSTLTQVYYPLTCWSVNNYHDFMRHKSAEFKPGYGGLFTLEFESEKAAATFFNALNIHKGPSLGVNVTLAQPYVQTVFARDKEWAASYGLHESIVRISAGLEDKNLLGRAFRKALRRADALRSSKIALTRPDMCFN